MKKSLIIFTLSLLQCACAAQQAARPESASLLSFAAIGAEITVSFEPSEATDELSQALAQAENGVSAGL